MVKLLINFNIFKDLIIIKIIWRRNLRIILCHREKLKKIKKEKYESEN